MNPRRNFGTTKKGRYHTTLLGLVKVVHQEGGELKGRKPVEARATRYRPTELHVRVHRWKQKKHSVVSYLSGGVFA